MKLDEQQHFASRLLIIALTLLGAVGLFGSGFWVGRISSPVSPAAIQQKVASYAPPLARSLNPGISAQSPPLAAMPMPQSAIPADASPELKELLQNRNTLSAKLDELRQKKGALDSEAMSQFRQENAALLQRQQELAQTVAKQQAGKPIPAPPPLQIPQNASPQLQTFLTDRDQLMRDRIAFMNHHLNDDPAARQAAMQQWHQQNAPLIQALQQESQALAQSKTTTTTN